MNRSRLGGRDDKALWYVINHVVDVINHVVDVILNLIQDLIKLGTKILCQAQNDTIQWEVCHPEPDSGSNQTRYQDSVSSTK